MFTIKNGFIFIFFLSLTTILYYLDIGNMSTNNKQQIPNTQAEEKIAIEENFNSAKKSVNIVVLDKIAESQSPQKTKQVLNPKNRTRSNSVIDKTLSIKTQQLYQEKSAKQAQIQYQKKQQIIALQKKAFKARENYYKQMQVLNNQRLSYKTIHNNQIQNQIRKNRYIKRQKEIAKQRQLQYKIKR